MLNKILKALYLILFFVTPLFMSPYTSELFEFNKMLFIYLITTLILFFWFLKMVLNKKIIFEKTRLFPFLLLFLLSQILSTYFSIDKHTSLFGYYGRFNGGLISIITYLILFFAYVSNFDNKFTIKLLQVSLFSSFIVMVWGLSGKIGYDFSCLLFTGALNNDCWTDQFRPGERMFSTLGQPNWLGAYLAIHFFIGLYFFIKSSNVGTTLELSINKYKYTILYTLYLIANFTSLLFTRSRSALFSVVIGFAIFVIFGLYQKQNKQLIKTLILCSLILILVAVFKTGIPKVDRYFNFLSSIKSNQQLAISNQQLTITDSFDIRKIVWQGAVDLGLRYPYFGTGVETFAYAYYFARPVSHNLTSEWDYLYNKAHNEYLNYLATTGFVGLGTYLLLIIIICLTSLIPLISQSKNHNTVYLLLSYVTILITNFFGFSTTTINLFFYLLPAFLMLLTKTTNSSNSPNLPHFPKVPSIIMVSLITLWLITNVIFYFIADFKYNKANKLYKQGDYSGAVEILSQALHLRYEHVYEDKLSYILASLSLISSTQKEEGTARKLMTLSNYYNLHSLQSSPYNPLYWKNRAKNYYLFYQITSSKDNLKIGLQALDKAMSLSSTDPKLPYTKALYYSLYEQDEENKDKKEAYKKLSLKAIDTSISLKPDYEDAYLLKGQLLKKYGQKEDANRVFQFILNKINPRSQEARKEMSPWSP